MAKTPEENFRILMIGLEAALRKEGIHERMNDTYFGTIEIAGTCKEGCLKHVRVRPEHGYPISQLITPEAGNLTPDPHSA